MNILGISCHYHDAAAALLKDGQLIAASEEERFSRKKHDSDYPELAIQYCLDQGEIKTSDLDYVVFYEKPFLKFERILLSSLATFPKSQAVFRHAMGVWLTEKLWIKQRILSHLKIPPARLLFSEHHLSHAAAALFCSPFNEAAILTVDGVGEWATATYGTGTARWNGQGQNQINIQGEMRFPHSIGLLYSTFTAWLGFEVNEGEYKVMGMAPYGKPKHVDKIWKVLKMDDSGGIELDLSYFSHHYHWRDAFTRKLVDLLGEPRDPKARFVTEQTSLYDDPAPPTREEMNRNQYYADVAASIQRVTEDIVLKSASQLGKRTGAKNLCLAGGVALNSKANYRLLRESGFQDIYIQPAAGDSGSALGAALWAYHMLEGNPRKLVMKSADWGAAYTEEQIEKALRAQNIPYERVEDEEKLLERTVEALSASKVVGWFQGGFEWGPRALGNRSILANPSDPKMKDIVNIKIKFREPFRPFAPSVLAERAEEIFDLPQAKERLPARFMLYVTPVREKWQEKLPAITHVDGTARLQTVFEETNPLYYRLIKKFGEKSGVPVLLNTSFNLKGEPIVNTPENALSTFYRSGMDLLILGHHIVEKQ